MERETIDQRPSSTRLPTFPWPCRVSNGDPDFEIPRGGHLPVGCHPMEHQRLPTPTPGLAVVVIRPLRLGPRVQIPFLRSGILRHRSIRLCVNPTSCWVTMKISMLVESRFGDVLCGALAPPIRPTRTLAPGASHSRARGRQPVGPVSVVVLLIIWRALAAGSSMYLVAHTRRTTRSSPPQACSPM